MLVLRGRLRHRRRYRRRTTGDTAGAEGCRRQDASVEPGPAVHQGSDARRSARRLGRPTAHRTGTGRTRGLGTAGTHRPSDRPDRRPPARDRRRTRPGRGRLLRVRPAESGGAIPGQQARQRVHRNQSDRIQLAAVHGQRRQRLQTLAGRGRAARFLRRLRPRRRVLRHRLEYGRLSSDPVPAHDGPGQGRRTTDRGRPAPHRHRRQGRPVPADLTRNRPGTAERTAAPAGGEPTPRRAVHRRTHRRLGRDAGLPRRLHPRGRRRRHRSTRRRHPPRGRTDRASRELDELLDDGTQPVHPRHLEHQRPDQPAPRDRRHLPHRKRPLLADRSAQRHGWTRNGLHGPRTTRATLRAGRRRPRLRRRIVEPAAGPDPHRGRVRHDRHVRPDGGR